MWAGLMRGTKKDRVWLTIKGNPMINWHTTWHQLWLDWGPLRLRQPLVDQQANETSRPLSAKEAWAIVRPEVEKFDSTATLRAVQSQGQVFADGRAQGWQFSVDALSRRAQGVFRWCLVEESGSQVVREVAPFPAIGSPIHRVVASGHGPSRLLDAAWDKMREDAIDLPGDFSDSTLLANALQTSDWDPAEMFLQPSPGAAFWRARCADKELSLVI
jgi:hypothetical protein